MGEKISIELLPSFLRTVRKLGDTQKDEIALALDEVKEGFGQPHRHASVGIRALGCGIFECRAGLNLRLMFRARKGRIFF